MAFISSFNNRRSVAFVRLYGILIISVLAYGCNEDEPGLVHSSRVGQWQYLTEKHGLASNHVNTVFEDSKGDFWIGTTRGLSLLRDNQFVNYNMINGLLDNSVFAISEDNEGNIWVGTRRGINILVDGQWQYFSYFYNAAVFGLVNMQNQGGMLIATGGYGLYHYNYEEPGFSRFEYIQNCDACNSLNSVFQASDESIWVASFAGVRRLRGSFVTRFDKSDGLPGNIATTISEDTWGNIWVGTAEGRTISKIAGNSVSQVNFNNGAEQNFIFGIQEDNNGNMWIGTVGNGLFHYDGAIMKQMYEGPPGTTVTTLFKDSRGNIWMGTSEEFIAI